MAQAIKVLERSRNSFLTTVAPLELIELSKQQRIYILAIDGNKVRVLSTSQDIKQFDDRSIGELLGYPKCCVDNYITLWNKGVRDFFAKWSISPMYSTDLNLFHRFMGLRLVFHLPCSSTCTQSQIIADDNKKWLSDNGYSSQLKMLQDILKWPVNYTSLHNMAEIETPVYKVSFPSDYYYRKLEYKYIGYILPQFTSQGFEGYYLPETQIPDTWTANGFPSLEVMNKCHEIILQLLKPTYYSLVDLGCGNGVLLNKAKQYCTSVTGYDISCKGENIINENLITWQGHTTIVVASCERFSEYHSLWDKVYKQCDYLIYYTYNGKLDLSSFDYKLWKIEEIVSNEYAEAVRLRRI